MFVYYEVDEIRLIVKIGLRNYNVIYDVIEIDGKWVFIEEFGL